MKSSPWVSVVAVLVMVAAPFVTYPILAAQLACMALLACSVNLLFGYGGLLSFGHSAFFGVAAYACGVATKEWGFAPELGVLFATLLAGAVGAVFGALATRRSGIYFSMITLALAELVYFVAVKAPFTHNEDGYQGIPRGHLFGLIDLKNDMAMYYFVLATVLLAWLAVRRIITSPFGEALEGIRENEDRATSLGYRVRTYKVIVFTMSAALAGMAGALKSLVFGIAAISDVYWHVSADAVIMMVLGGVGTLVGPFIGASILVAIGHALEGELSTLVPFVLGLIFMVAVLTCRRGLLGEIKHALEVRARARTAPPAPQYAADAQLPSADAH